MKLRRSIRAIVLGVFLLLAAGMLLKTAIGAIIWFRMQEVWETHVAPGKPTIRIYITSFVDSSWHASMGLFRKRIFDNVGCYNQFIPRLQCKIPPDVVVAKCTPASGRYQIAEVFWSADGKRVALCGKGFFVQAYDRTTGQKIDRNSSPHYSRNGELTDPEALDTDIAKFLTGQNVK